MSCILHIDTSTKITSVALSEGGEVIFSKEQNEGGRHAESCGLFVEEALSFANSHAIPLDAVAVSEGPGSYTGLRIGVSMAKGVCYGYKIPLIGISTLELLCAPVLLFHDEMEDDALLVPMIDARRMEVYAAVYNRSLNALRAIQPDIVEADTYAPFLDTHPVYFFGDGAEKCQAVISHPNARFIPGIHPSARHMVALAELAVAKNNYADVAYFEPFYLKEFIAIKSKNLL